MTLLIAPYLAMLGLFAVSTLVGILPARKLIMVYEAKHELKRGSAGFLRTMAGWSVIAVWLLITWFLATIIGDWNASGDLDGAIARGWVRFQVIMEILIAILESDN